MLDWQSQAQVAVTLIGTDPAAIDPRGQVEKTLVAFCGDHSIGSSQLPR